MTGVDPPTVPRLIFDWKYRPRTWLRLTYFVVLALLTHVACFVLFSVHTPASTRAVPAPSTVTLAPSAGFGAAGVESTATSLIAPVKPEGLDLPQIAVPENYEPSYQNHPLPREPWPARPMRLAWPEISGASRPALPPPSEPSSPSPPPR
jgi:hypothetical protein